ncbi:hypothetical protein DYF80_13345 [Salmonella enterica subsp. enterica]|nr:hypothetical protein [Salmonella enterica subsp. enterica]EHE5269724.1 hypothetical protein [Salmonella enterica subsp. enterica serovar Uganda]EJV0479034.1 hypothetical protein [Salmonella enterica subsp. enterica serovar Uganda]
MTTNNHPANGPVSLDRLHQISEILSKAAAQSDGGNLGYAMADAVKVIDGAIAVFGAEPVAWVRYCSDGTIDGPLLNYQIDDCRKSTWTPLYAAPQLPQLLQSAPVVPDGLLSAMEEVLRISDRDHEAWHKARNGIASCRTAMLQAGNSPATPDCWCRTCRPVTMSDMRFVVCPDCGNKRCPHANDHRNACTGSNEPGQAGSAYSAAPQQEVK